MTQTQNILVVDDDPDHLEFILTALRRGGWTAEGVHSGRTALRHLAQGEFRLVLTDILMPDYDGVEFAADLASQFPNVVVVGMTGASAMLRDPISTLLRLRGVARILSKPIEMQGLLAELRQALAEHEAIALDPAAALSPA